jgi:hypothetical protein
MKTDPWTLFLPILSILVILVFLWPKKRKKKTPEWFHDEARKNADFFDKK